MNKKLNSIIPYLFEGHLVLALSTDWIKLFNKIPSFSVYIDNSQRLHLESDEAVQDVSS